MKKNSNIHTVADKERPKIAKTEFAFHAHIPDSPFEAQAEACRYTRTGIATIFLRGKGTSATQALFACLSRALLCACIRSENFSFPAVVQIAVLLCKHTHKTGEKIVCNDNMLVCASACILRQQVDTSQPELGHAIVAALLMRRLAMFLHLSCRKLSQ